MKIVFEPVTMVSMKSIQGKSGLSAEAFTKAMDFVTYDYQGNELLRKEKLLYIYKLPLSGVADMYALIGIDVETMREAFSQNSFCQYIWQSVQTPLWCIANRLVAGATRKKVKMCTSIDA